MKYIKIVLFFSILILFAGCNSKKSEIVLEEEIDEIIYVNRAQFENAEMKIGQLEEKPFAEVVRSSGMIDVSPQNKAVISAFLGGYIKDFPVRVGSQVKKGDRLLTLENPEFISLQQEYSELSEQLNFLKSEYERQQIMRKENITSEKSFLKAESDYKSNVARIQSLEKKLEMLHINPNSVKAGKIVSQVNVYSPIDGFVIEIFGMTGSYVSASDKIMELVNTDELLLNLKVFEKDLFAVQADQEIWFRVPEISEEKFKGKIDLIGASISENRMIPVQGSIENPENRPFTPGMFVEAEFVISEENRWALPEDAVTDFEGKNYVLVVQKEENDELELLPVQVEIGEVYRGFIHIKNVDDFSQSKKILTKGAYVLLVEEGGGHAH